MSIIGASLKAKLEWRSSHRPEKVTVLKRPSHDAAVTFAEKCT